MRTGNAVLDVLIRVVAIALMAALLVWILGVLKAPSILGTLIWILAVLAIVALIAGNFYFGGCAYPAKAGVTRVPLAARSRTSRLPLVVVRHQPRKALLRVRVRRAGGLKERPMYRSRRRPHLFDLATLCEQARWNLDEVRAAARAVAARQAAPSRLAF